MRLILILIGITRGDMIEGKWTRRVYRSLLATLVFLGVFWLMATGMPHTGFRDKIGVALLFGFVGGIFAILTGQLDDL